jgi:5,10-methylenetetrahydromethanopterin reductase
MLRLGIGVLQRFPPDELVQLVEWCEQLGYSQLWYANEKFYRDPWIGLTLAALHTRTMRLGTFVADPYTVHPALTAIAIASLDEVSRGRAMLLLGAGGAGAAPLGIPRTRPVQALSEAIALTREILVGEEVDFQGEIISFRGGKLGFAARRDIPIYVASRGNLVLSMAGALADGVMVATYATPVGVRHGLDRVARGARRANRRLEDLELFARVDTCVADDAGAALEAVRPMVARLLGSSYPDRGFVHAVGLEVPTAFEQVARHRRPALNTANAHLIPDDLVRAFTWAGTAEQVAQQVAAVADVGLRNITILPHPTPAEDVQHTIGRFAEQVRPRVEALLGTPSASG